MAVRINCKSLFSWQVSLNHGFGKTCFSFFNAHYVKDLFNFRQLAVQKERNDLICQFYVFCLTECLPQAEQWKMYLQCHHKNDFTAFVPTFPEGLEKDGALFPLNLVEDKDEETWSSSPL